MKFTLDRDDFTKVMSKLARVVERRHPSLPILGHVALKADKRGLYLAATDLDIEVSDRIDIELEEAGSITVAANILTDILRKLPATSKLSISTIDEGRIALQSGRSRFQLNTLPFDQFPTLTATAFTHSFSMNGKDLKRMIEKVEFAISTEETRYYLNGVYFHEAKTGSKTALRGVATDGHRLAQFDLALPDGATGIPGVIIPRKTVGEISKLIDDGNGDIRIDLHSNMIRMTFTSGTILCSKLIDGTFPDYQRVIPDKNELIAIVHCDSLAAAIDRVAAVQAERGRAVKLDFEGNVVTLTISHPDSGTATEDAEIDYQGRALQIGFNNRYLSEILGKIDGKKAEIKLHDSGSPTIIQSAEETEAIYVLMPMRV